MCEILNDLFDPNPLLSMLEKRVCILSSSRTPIGGLNGSLSKLTAPELGACSLSAVVEKAGVSADRIDEVYMGNVISAGLKQAPARQASLLAGFSEKIPCTTISKVCGSGMKAVMLGSDQILTGNADIVLAGGMESMSSSPHLILKTRKGLGTGHSKLLDSMFVDGLEDAGSGELMGKFAQKTADEYEISRNDMDMFATESLLRSQISAKEGWFDGELDPVNFDSVTGQVSCFDDELPGKARVEKIPKMKPAFGDDGSITAANASSISDGAAAILLASESQARELGVKPEAFIVGYQSYAQLPQDYCLAPIGAIEGVLSKLGWEKEEVDLYEINEAFSVVPILAMRALKIDHSKVNINGGACSLGHPLGASGARIIVSLIGALKRVGGKRGVAAICIGGGEATAIAIELAD